MSSKRPLEDAIVLEPCTKKQKIDIKEDEIEEFTMKCDIVQDYIKQEDINLQYNHSLIISNMYRIAIQTNKTLINHIKNFILQYSTLNELFKTEWSNKYKGTELLLNKSNLCFYTTECDTNQSCRTNKPFQNNKKSKIKIKFYRNDECCFQASFIGVHYFNIEKDGTKSDFYFKRIYNNSPFAPQQKQLLHMMCGMYRGAVNKIAYGLLECGGWTDPNVDSDDIDYGMGGFANQNVITIETDFTDVKNKKLSFFINDNDKAAFEYSLPYFDKHDQWYASVGFGSGES
eukprot:332633_1